MGSRTSHHSQKDEDAAALWPLEAQPAGKLWATGPTPEGQSAKSPVLSPNVSAMKDRVRVRNVPHQSWLQAVSNPALGAGSDTRHTRKDVLKDNR